MHWLSRVSLASLTLVLVPPVGTRYTTQDFSGAIRSATMILEHVERACLTDVGIGFQTGAIADLGSHLSGPDAPLEDCKLLEETLLTFPSSRILVHYLNDHQFRRAGRAKFWLPIIGRAFPTLNERGQLTVHSDFMHR